MAVGSLNPPLMRRRSAPHRRTGPAEQAGLHRSRLGSALPAAYGRARVLRSRRLLMLILRLCFRLEGGEFRSASAREIMNAYHGVDIGAYSYGCFDPVRFAPGTVVGRYTCIAGSVHTYRRNHPLGRITMHPVLYSEQFGASAVETLTSAPLDIGHDAWIGAHAVILPGCRRIGIGAVVGAGAVVTHDVDPFTIVVGNPARPTRRRFCEETAARLVHSQWWTASLEDPDTDLAELERTLIPAPPSDVRDR